MPLGLWAPTFDYRDLASEMETMIANLPRYKDAAMHWNFKTWNDVCSSWLADVKNEA
jgi:hypothetical protein